MKHLTLAGVLALALVAAGCSDSAEDTADTAAPAPAESSAAAEPSESAAAGGENVLTGTVGEEGDPDAFVITLTDASGQEVTTLPAGEYEIQVDDPSTIHNFHLTGAGVDETTTVPEVTETTWTVTLHEGDYTFICDPHPRMVGEFSVTA